MAWHNESCDHLLVNLPSFLKERWCSTNLRVNTNECVCSVVELFLQRNHDALELALRLLTNVSCNLRNITQYKNAIQKIKRSIPYSSCLPQKMESIEFGYGLFLQTVLSHSPSNNYLLYCSVAKYLLFSPPPPPTNNKNLNKQQPKQTHKNNLCPVMGRSFTYKHTHTQPPNRKPALYAVLALGGETMSASICSMRWEEGSGHLANVGVVQGGVNLIQNKEGGWLVTAQHTTQRHKHITASTTEGRNLSIQHHFGTWKALPAITPSL